MGSASIESRIDGFLGKYTPEIEAQLRDAKGRLLASATSTLLVFETPPERR